MGDEDKDRLAGYVETWWQAVQDLTAVLEQVPAEQWATPTDLAGWDVRACASHTAHLESILAGNPEETADVGEPPHVTGLMGLYTEIGVCNRRDRTPDEIVAEIREVTGRRHAQLLADPPTDASARPPVIFAGVPWTWEVLLRNRPLDIWMHEQDVRRAVGRPGGLDSRPAQHTADYLTESFGFVVAKKAGAAPSTTAVLDVAGSPTIAYAVNDAGRGERLPVVPADPTVTLRTDRESFVVLAGGRRTPPAGAVTIEGDAELGARIVSVMATTP
ncbi:maleylpyruvate isomerase family mycothiol-dependent enzyme [Nocardioides sp.]|uniref:maleylpyruvate isomerase family mycothiol-dependent enzyme n=1 Tax=Nocardioides sp. TaxID=35761 RepID=UPI0027245ECC|nr:maleylpyruvate isomerase family mycothiol-dependent enzyme [Nocardioides sp.]MDO9456612.1 maleylpyruvate isomerase family mycothiol-dependent enzyme [Nocardioides sp.]